ncbi:translation elongation factor Ts [Roseibacillus ishigakijimensis]|uniref:Elongation factor Ts n=1 Tax=Roseibacillus ishigakijimensis TaxID=454146 RepID=A0A934VGY1_9BACT|nr:translation elongation factor Ts [Roseibacillus ishigakijimensis]MBK1833358.1 elongation factor Ts [Roseibacillus ishigakijimensis]
MAITASQVKELRERTNVAMMECKKALTETNGDMEAAIKILRERSGLKAAKKADREAKEGLVSAQLSADGKSGVLVEINCETDFVAKNDNFGAFVTEIAETVAATDAQDLESALNVPMGEDTVGGAVKAKVIELGENLQFSRFERFDVAGAGAIASYIHMGGKVGVLLEVSCEKEETPSQEAFKDLVKDITLHIAAAAPAGLNRSDIPAELVEAEKEVFRKQMENSGKPAEILEKIIEGKLGKFYSEQCLVDQGFVKDPDISISALLEQKGKELGDTLTINRFTRFAVGS